MAVTDKNNFPTIIDELRKLEKMVIQVGPILDNEVKKYAGVHEYGATIAVSDEYRKYVLQRTGFNLGDTITIPERSYVRSSFDDKGTMKRVFSEANSELNSMFNGEGSAEEVADAMGAAMSKIIQEKIQSGVGPENSPVTVALKGHDATLQDSGALFESIGHRIA